jgi:flagellum-specific peptidoglycan hydrolase FlgJ
MLILERTNNVKDSIKDYVKFLHENKRYKDAGVFKAKTVLAQGQALKNAGYATALNYPTTINKVYESVKPYIVASEKKIQKKLECLKLLVFQ